MKVSINKKSLGNVGKVSKIMLKCFFAGLLCAVTIQFSFTQVRQSIEVDVFSVDDGLSQTQVNCMFQDSKGFLWIGARDGLNKYDGKKFKIYQYQPGDTTSISNNYIRYITEDQYGYIWIATNNGLNRFDRNLNEFKRYTHNSDDPNSISEGIVYNVFIDNSNDIWVKTSNNLEKLNQTTCTFSKYTHFNDLFNFVQPISFFPIYEDSNGILWIGTKDGLNFFDRDLKIFKRFSHNRDDKHSISNNYINAIAEDQNGNLWIGTSNGLNILNTDNQKINRVFGELKDHPLSNQPINTIKVDKHDNLWVGTNSGIYYFDVKSNKVVEYSFRTPFQSNFPATLISSILIDNSDILWVGSLQGLVKYDLKGKKFNLYRKNHAGYPNFSGNTITSIYEDNNKLLWIGIWDKGLNIFNRKTGNVVQYYQSHPNPKYRIPDNYVQVIFEDSNGSVLLGTNNGVVYFDIISQSFLPFSESSSTNSQRIFNNNQVYSIIEGSDGLLWFATAYGIHVFNKNGNHVRSIHNIQVNNEIFNFNRVLAILQDSENDLWIGTDKGLLHYNNVDSTYTRYFNPTGSGEIVLSSNEIYKILESSDGTIWVGTSAGLNHFNRNNGDFKIFTEKDGLPNRLIYAIIEDDRGVLWLSTNKGLIEFDPHNHTAFTYDMMDGLQSNEFIHGAYYKSKSGELFFGGIAGFNAFYADSINRNEHVPPIEITFIEFITEDVIDEMPVGNLETITISHDIRLFNIEFTALDFTNPSKNNYAYMLYKEGEMGSWIHIGNRNIATFSNLPTGTYIFSVKGSNNDQVWNHTGDQLRIVVVGPVWKSNKAFAIYFFLISLIVLLSFRVWTRRLRKSNRILKEKEVAATKIALQKEELTLKNKSITDSINYAKRIQEAMMPSQKVFKKVLTDSFILHLPKDIVSGDFYWISENKNKIYVAAVDCTGHGVPGAFMSIIGFELFRKITYVQGIEEPAEILNVLRNDFAEIFGDVENITLRDGMDVAFCAIDKKSKTISFSGAFNPLYLIRDDKIIEVKGDRFSVSIDTFLEKQYKFTSHHIPYQKDDVVYLFTDGYADQFGGIDQKKFKYRRFRHLLLNIYKLPMDKQYEFLLETLNNWKGNLEQVDDILVLGFKL